MNAFDEKLRSLKLGNESLIETIATTHFRVCQTFLVSQLKASSDVAYDITADTLVKFRQLLLTDKLHYGNLSALFTIEARNRYYRYCLKTNKNPFVSTDDITNLPEDLDDDQPYDEKVLAKLQTALSQIGKDCYDLIQGVYYLGLPLRIIAQQRAENNETLFTNESSVKTKLADCRKKLKNLMS